MTDTRPSLARKVRHIMLIPVSVVVVALLILLGVLLWWSPGKPLPVVDQSGKPVVGSISEKTFVEINGVRQGMFIKSRDASNPVLLYLHGGMPDYFLTQQYPTGLEDLFTVVWWEQRGSGLSYSPDLPQDTLTVDQLVSDTLAMTNYLRQRFNQDKIYLMGHSGGTLIGIKAAARAPELFHAYIGQEQMSYQLKSEKLAYDYMLAEFKKNGNADMARKLEAAPVTMSVPLPASYVLVRDDAMHSLGIGTTHDMRSVLTGIIIPSFQFREYTLGEKINLWRAKSQSGISIVWSEMLATDLNKDVPELRLPVYFFGGVYDYTVSYSEAKSYFMSLKAPLKGFYSFERSAHSPLFEEPGKARQIMQQDVLAGTNNLADLK